MDDFKINPYHFFDSKLLEVKSDSIFQYDWKELVETRKKQFPLYQFIVTDNEEILYSDSSLGWAFNSEDLSISLSQYNKVYWINLHIGTRQTHIVSDNEIEIIHENLVPQNIKALTYFELKENSTYTHVIQNHSDCVFHHYLFLNHFSKNKCYFLQPSDNTKNKINQKHYLSKDSASVDLLILNKVQPKQLRDDFIEFEHLCPNTTSNVQYFSMNGGKSVSQVNSIIPSHVKNCETNQLIKHILTDDSAQSFSKPNLMIKNPDVIASHGCSIGSYNEEELFYIMQRGINLDSAKKIIQNGIIHKALDQHKENEILKDYFL